MTTARYFSKTFFQTNHPSAAKVLDVRRIDPIKTREPVVEIIGARQREVLGRSGLPVGDSRKGGVRHDAHDGAHANHD